MDTLIVITGPTGVGKSNVAIEIAKALSTEIISADSRQIYRGIPVTTAAPTPLQLAEVPHHFVGTLPLTAYYSASLFEQEALSLLPSIFARCNGMAVVCGGSMLYIDALCNGLDDIPTVSSAIRTRVSETYETRGKEYMLHWLDSLDPDYGKIIDRNNTKRVIHAIEICLQADTTYTSLRQRKKRARPFKIKKYMLSAPRDLLFDRINTRTLQMVRQGMIEEVRGVSDLRHLNSLNTVGFKEMFRYIDGDWSLDEAIARLQKNTRVYAKKQLTWFARDPDILSIDTSEADPKETILLNL